MEDLFDDKDPPWMTGNIKKKTMAKKHAYKSFNANIKNYDAYLKLQTYRIVRNDIGKKRGLLLCSF